MPGFSRNRYAEILEPSLLLWGDSSTQPTSLDPKYNSHSQLPHVGVCEMEFGA